MAKALKHSTAAGLLAESLQEEQNAARLLLDLAKPMLRETAAAAETESVTKGGAVG
jgi:hypothetical protein